MPMLMTPEELSDLRDHISLARSKAINFGICFGRSSPKNLIMNVDRQKSPMLLERYAKLDGESPRSLRGTFRISGNRFVMDLDGRVPQGGAWQLHQFFRKLGFPYKIELIEPGKAEKPAKPERRKRQKPEAEAAPSEPLTPEQQPIDTEDPIVADDPVEDKVDQVQDEDDDTVTDPRQARWAQLCPRLEQAVTEFEGTKAPKASAVRKAWQAAIAVAERGDHASALKAAVRIKAAIFEDNDPEPAPDPDAAKWQQLAAALNDQMARIPSGGAVGARLHQAWAEATKRAETGDHKTALTIARKLIEAIKRART